MNSYSTTQITNETGTSHQESSDDYSRVVVMLDPRWRVIECRDGIQWIIQRREKSRDEGHWRGVRYCTHPEGPQARCRGACIAALAVCGVNARRFARAHQPRDKEKPRAGAGRGVERSFTRCGGSLNSSDPNSKLNQANQRRTGWVKDHIPFKSSQEQKVIITMSNMLNEIVKRTEIKPMAAKCVMLHVAEMVRDRGDWQFWQSHKTTAKHLGTDRRTIQRIMQRLEDAGLIFCQTERAVKGGYVNVYMVDVEALLSLPCVDEKETRREYVKGLVEAEGYIHPADFPDANPAGVNHNPAGEDHEGAGVNHEGAGETHPILNNPYRSLNEPKGARDLSDHSLSESEPNVVTLPQRGDSDQRSDDYLEREKPKHDFGPELDQWLAGVERRDRKADCNVPLSSDRSPHVSTHVSADVPREVPQGGTQPQRSRPVSPDLMTGPDWPDTTGHGDVVQANIARLQRQATGQPDHAPGHQPDMRGDAPASAPDRSPASERDRQADVTSYRDRASASERDLDHHHQTGGRHVIH